MRPTSIVAVFTLVIVGVIIADVLTHPSGTQAASNGMVSILNPTYNALLGGGNKGGG